MAKIRYRLTDPKRFACFIGAIVLIILLLSLLLRGCGKEEKKGSASSANTSSVISQNSLTDSGKNDSDASQASDPQGSGSQTAESQKDDPQARPQQNVPAELNHEELEKQIVGWTMGFINMTSDVVIEEENPIDKLFKIVIDPGCGGTDSGYAGQNDVREKDINLAVALLLRDSLKDIPKIEVVLTRESDEDVTTTQRAALINASGADLAISLHCGIFAGTDGKAGITTYYDLEDVSPTSERATVLNQAKKAAAEIQKQAIAYTSAIDNGIAAEHYDLLNNSDIPMILVEMAYLTDEDDLARITDPSSQADLADGLRDGIDSALKKMYPDRVNEYKKSLLP